MYLICVSFNVSIHALLAECDRRWIGLRAGINPFQSTHSLRSATGNAGPGLRYGAVSIHALLAECDRYIEYKQLQMLRFQSTHSLRSATCCTSKKRKFTRFQSTHSLRSATGDVFIVPRLFQSFNPRTPCGVRLRPTLYIATQQSKSYFAPTSLKRPSLHGCSF